MADDEHAEGGEEPQPDTDEGKRIMEERTRSKAERQKEELAEYEESRREEREKEAAEIAALREKRIQRAKERVEEEKKMAELRAQEDIRRRTEEEERRKKKTEEETRKKEERDQKKREAEDRLSKKGPNFVITKRSDAEKLDSVMSKEELQKSKEQLEEEKQAILSQRIQPLKLDGMDGTKLQEKAKELYEHMRRLVGDKYDLEQRFKRQQYDMIELAERARQMNKGKKKGATVMVDESFDRLADKFTSAPPKIQLCSKYERHTDHRTYVERKDLFKKLAEEPPPPEIQHVAGQGPQQEESAPAAAEEAAE
ncbi:hypothetical protein V1264_002709 [Littorina saxatilis]|uniref:Troponin T n=1 Tax=Littorina saxatilis TaxID=31220 RepID=A0AAN9G967_9CAEN